MFYGDRIKRLEKRIEILEGVLLIQKKEEEVDLPSFLIKEKHSRKLSTGKRTYNTKKLDTRINPRGRFKIIVSYNKKISNTATLSCEIENHNGPESLKNLVIAKLKWWKEQGRLKNRINLSLVCLDSMDVKGVKSRYEIRGNINKDDIEFGYRKNGNFVPAKFRVNPINVID